MLYTIQNDLLKLAEQGSFDVIVHGCNCFNTMGSGIAKYLRQAYPEIYNADLCTTKGDKSKIGTYTHYKTPSGFTIVNAYTQYFYGKSGVDLFEYGGFELILAKLKTEFGGVRYGFPRIGMGLAGGNPQQIIPMLEQFSTDIEQLGGSVTLVEL